MQAHRKDSGDIYTLDLNDINNESRNFIYKQPDGSYRLFSAATVMSRSV